MPLQAGLYHAVGPAPTSGFSRTESLGEPVIVEVLDRGSPAHETRLHRQSGSHGDVAEHGPAIVFVKGMGVGAEVGFENVEVPVIVEIADPEPQAALLLAILVERHSGLEAALGERAVVVIAEEQAGRCIACHVNVRAAVAVEIGGGGV